MSKPVPTISFGIIVLNGEPFIRYCLRSLYPFAHEILVVEGATESAKSISTLGGHSIDSTLSSIKKFIEEEDPEKKITLITKEGFWKEKKEQSQAYAQKASGDYLWQVDVDEFYKKEDMRCIIQMLEKDPSITAVSFITRSFWGGIQYTSDSPYIGNFHRLFKWGPGYAYTNHRPPTVENESRINLRSIEWIPGETLAKKNIYLYHYSLLFPKQVHEKSAYYRDVTWGDWKHMKEWEVNNYVNLEHPFRVHNTYNTVSWLDRYKGTHPEEIDRMMNDIKEEKISTKLRPTADIEHLLQSRSYQVRRFMIKTFYTLVRFLKSRIRFMLIKMKLHTPS